MPRLLSVVLVLSVVFPACAKEPPTPPPGVLTVRDLDYAGSGNPRQKLDLYLPETYQQPLPMVIAHGRAFLPPALVGRGVTLMNLFGIGTAGLMQMAAGQIYATLPGQPQTAYAALFLAYGALVIVGLSAYLWSQDRTD